MLKVTVPLAGEGDDIGCCSFAAIDVVLNPGEHTVCQAVGLEGNFTLTYPKGNRCAYGGATNGRLQSWLVGERFYQFAPEAVRIKLKCVRRDGPTTLGEVT
jgi:hypothetical protein